MKMDINHLIENCEQFFIKNSYVQRRIDAYKSLWRRGILRYMNEKEKTIFTSDVGRDFIRECFPEDDLSCKAREMVRSVRVLDDYASLGYVRPRAIVYVKHLLFGEIGLQMQKFINHLHSMRRRDATIKVYEHQLSRFLFYLTNEGVTSINEINERHILKFVSTMFNNMNSHISCLRILFRYWYENQISNVNFEDVLRNYKWTKREKIPSYYDAEEIYLIESSIERNSGTGKRNYAVFLLASRLGLRASDIANLKFSNIDWEKNEITLTQYKTGNPVKLPLLCDVGNAIIDYLKYGRFKSCFQHIFLSCSAPYVSATSSMICGIIRGVIEKSNVSTGGRRSGAHSLRHSLASNLLKNETPISVISGVLGHESIDTTMSYLRIDLVSLQKCALPVSSVSDDFYTQNGGVFYE